MLMQNLLLVALYAAYGVFLVRFLIHALLWWRGAKAATYALTWRKRGAATIYRAILDLLFFTRLLRANNLLWLVEWFFHASLLLILLRHLRYVLDPVPSWVWAAQPWGLIAGYLLPVALAAILVIRQLTKREIYSSRANLILLTALLIISATGVVMHALQKPDLVGVKDFMMGVVTLAPTPWPGGFLATIHLILFLVILPLLPTHIFIVPLTIIDARRREDALDEVLHER